MAFVREINRKLPPAPPPDLRVGIGDGEYWETGEAVASHIIETCGDLNGLRVLDIGCGTGRVAYFLAEALGETGSYVGFDVQKAYIDWCRKKLRLDSKRFEFRHIPLYSSTYNLASRSKAEALEFPWPEGEFDLVIATSLFTHLMPEATAQYAAEAYRVLRPGGRLFATFYVLNDQSNELLADEETETHPSFEVVHSWGRVESEESPEDAVAFDEEWLSDVLLTRTNYDLLEFEEGWWRQKYSKLYQDVVFLRKPKDTPPLPPESLRSAIGDGDFWKTGHAIVDQVRAEVGDMAGMDVLDIGCGLGRVAFFLDDEIGPAGSYTGFDANEDYTDWCRESLGLSPERFSFQAFDLFSTLYNPSGSVTAEEFVFPWPDESFDLLIATSLFTHLEGAETANFARQAHRVLRPGGRFFASFYVLNEGVNERVEAGETWPVFPFVREYGRIGDEEAPEKAVAHKQEWLEDLLIKQLDFELQAFNEGFWRSNKAPNYQDDVVLRKR